MAETTTAPSVYVLMGRVLADLPAIGKERNNAEQGFKFRGIDDVMDALNPVLAKHGVFVVPDVLERRDEQVLRGQRQTRWERVLLHVRFRFHGPNGDCVEASAWGEGLDNADKGSNKAMTMAFKACLIQTFCVATKDMDDPDAHTPPEASSQHGWNGWESKEEHDAATGPIVEQLRAAPQAVRDAMKAWQAKEHVSASAVHRDRFDDWMDHALGLLASDDTAAPEDSKNDAGAYHRTEAEVVGGPAMAKAALAGTKGADS